MSILLYDREAESADTTQKLSISRRAQLSEEVGSKKTLLVLCLAFCGNVERFPNLTVKKIPKQVIRAASGGIMITPTDRKSSQSPAERRADEPL